MAKALCAGLAAASLFGRMQALDTAPSCAQYGIGYNDSERDEFPNGGLLATAKDCQATCQRTVYCEHFTFYNNSGGCWLQGINVTEVSSPYVISGPMLCPGEEKAAVTGGVGLTTPLAMNPAAQAIWAKVAAGNVTVKQFISIEALTAMGPPDSVATQVVAGTNYIFSWKDGTNVTVFDQPWTNTLEVTETNAASAGDVKSKEIASDSTGSIDTPADSEDSEDSEGGGGMAWWAWLLIALGVLIIVGGVCYTCMGGQKKPKKKTEKKPTLKEWLDDGPRVEERDIESAQPEQRQPLVSSQQAATASAAAAASAQYVTVPAGGSPVVMPQAQSPMAMPLVQSGASGVRSIPAGSVAAPAQYVYQSPTAGGMSAAAAQNMFTQLDTDGDGVLSRQEMAAMSQGQR